MSNYDQPTPEYGPPVRDTMPVNPNAEMAVLRGSLEAVSSNRITRKRYLELTNLAYETVQFLESKGLKKGEQCVFRRIGEELWFTE